MDVLSFTSEQNAIDAVAWIDSDRNYPCEVTQTWDDVKKHISLDKWYITKPVNYNGVVGYTEEETDISWWE